MSIFEVGRKLGYLTSFAIFGLSLLVSIPGHTQVTGATVSGSVTDGSGGVVPQAKIEIRNTATGVVTSVTSNADGFYTVSNLLPGIYQVSVSKEGFKTLVRQGVTLEVGGHQLLDVILEVGQVSQTVEVNTEAPTVDLTSSSISDEVNATTVRELPLNGRSWTDLANLQPSVAPIQTQQQLANNGANRGNRGFGLEISVSGGRPGQNNYRIDGISVNNWDNGGPGSVLGGNLGVDAIAEFSVITTNYSAEYGKTSGGVINAVTRSGTNEFHGALYEFLRNSALDAPNYFDSGVVPPYRRNQFGGSAGAPIQKGRTFIFGDYEGIRQFQGVSTLNIVPSLAARVGNICSVPSSSACSASTVAVDPSVQQYLPLLPVPNQGIVPGSNGDQGYFNFVQNQVAQENYVFVRVDHKFSDKDGMFGSYNYDKTPFTAPDSFGDVLDEDRTYRQIYTLEETHVFSPSLLNTERFAFHRENSLANRAISAINPLASETSLGSAPGTDADAITISGGYTAFLGGLGGGSSYYYHWNTFEGDDDASLVIGTHTLKFGAAVERDQENMGTFPGVGKFTFSSLANFLTNHAKQYSGVNPIISRSFRTTIAGVYLQDDWRFRHNLTLNLGLRYEMSTVLTDANGRLSHLNTPSSPTQVVGTTANCLTAGCSALTVGPFMQKNPTLRDFQPRVGFAWDPFGDGKTAVRGGFGIFDVLPLIYQFQATQASVAPFSLKTLVQPVPAGSFFANAQSLAVPSAYSAGYVEQDPHASYVMQYNLNIEREIAPGWGVMVGYVGSRGTHLARQIDNINEVVPTLTSAGYVFPYQGITDVKLNPNFGGEHGELYDGLSFYDALDVQVTKKLTHGLQLQTSFTWAKSIDTSSTTNLGDQFNNAVASPPTALFNEATNRALSDFDVGRSLVVNWIWEIPSAKRLSGPVGWVTKGWQLGSILTLEDGIPFTTTFGKGGDPLGSQSTDDYDYPNRIGGSGCKTAVNPGNVRDYINQSCFAIPTAPSAAFYAQYCNPSKGTYPQCYNLVGNAGRNDLIGPGLFDMDFSVFKNNPIPRISETFNAQFRVEMFNVLNRANFGVPLTALGQADIFSSTGAPESAGGNLLATSTSAREIQFGLKLIW